MQSGGADGREELKLPSSWGPVAIFRIRPFRNAFALRGALTWIAIRLLAAFAGVRNPDVLQEGYLVAVVVLAVFLDARRRDEALFLGNLGVPSWTIAAAALPLPVLLELLVP